MLSADSPPLPLLPAWSEARSGGRMPAWAQRHRRLLMALAVPLLAALLLAAALGGLVQREVTRQHAAATAALAEALARAPGTLPHRLEQMPAWALAAGWAQAEVRDGAGRLLGRGRHDAGAQALPAWFMAALRLPAEPAPRGLQVDGRVLLVQAWTDPSHLLGLLWQTLQVLLLAVPAAMLAVATLFARQRARLRSAVADTLAQTERLGDAGYRPVRHPALPELAPLADGLDRLHERLGALFALQATQLEALRLQAHHDLLTGLANRRHFTAALDALLHGENAPPRVTLVLLRLADLAGMNQRLGRRSADRVLQAVAQVLQNYPQRVAHCLIGRLDGGDFALLLPTGGVAGDTLQALRRAVSAGLVVVDPAARVVATAVEVLASHTAEAGLAQAEAALRRAEAEAACPPVVDAEAAAELGSGAASELLAADDESTGWHRRLMRALSQGRVRLGEFAVCTPDGRTLMLDSPLRVQLVAGGAYEPAARWLAQAVRSQLSTAIDERALMLALAAIARDGQARCINMAAASLASGVFVEAATRRLAAAPEAACRLWVDLPESLALDAPQRLRELSRRWRPLGVMLGLEHAGAALSAGQGLPDLGLDCVRIDARYVNGIAGAEAADARRYLHGLVQLVQGVGLSVTAEGVRAAEDLDVLWSLGFDAATGPAVTPLPAATLA
ncbi:EAL domain-containing protein [Aquabacterium sp. OR-4]|uniref:EAL domain-containing protein n=1 Tax=Aquabacterium sp. OR-4 TaxID=2978127 RepID=UPI0028C75206|nr:EAL domain-containing protein [Aquabacterium sp. OR-4]MDT7835149.1 EAL domain-containing protein [Aquabacterium sp. OR-4]